MSFLMRFLFSFFVVMLFGNFQGCASAGANKEISSRNKPILFQRGTVESSDVSRTVMGFAKPSPALTFAGSPSSDAFVGLALTGGGSRAANFSLAVMQELEQMGLLEHVNAISTVSGGSLAGAYFALHSESMDWEFAKVLMRDDFIRDWVVGILRPDNLVRQFASDFDRSDIMASIFDKKLFDGATFSRLGGAGPRRPKLFINATNSTGQLGATGAEGLRFVFDTSTFLYDLNSNIDSYPISSAVTASAAFPGVFNRVTLERFERPLASGDASLRPAKSSVPARFVHLMDGGPSDNLGIETLVQAAFSHYMIAPNDGTPRTPGPCLLILADAFQPNRSKQTELESDPRTLFDHFIDTDFFDAISILLAQRREESLKFLGLRDDLGLTDRPSPIELVTLPGIGEDASRIIRRIGQLKVPYVCWGSGITRRECSIAPISMGSSTSDFFSCKIWHLSLSDVRGSGVYDRNGRPIGSYSRLQANGVLARIVESIPTHFKLKGAEGCSPKVLQAALYQAASFLTRDPQSVASICNWADESKLLNRNVCLSPSEKQQHILPFPVTASPRSAPYLATVLPRMPEPALKCSGDESFLTN